MAWGFRGEGRSASPTSCHHPPRPQPPRIQLCPQPHSRGLQPVTGKAAGLAFLTCTHSSVCGYQVFLLGNNKETSPFFLSTTGSFKPQGTAGPVLRPGEEILRLPQPPPPQPAPSPQGCFTPSLEPTMASPTPRKADGQGEHHLLFVDRMLRKYSI